MQKGDVPRTLMSYCHPVSDAAGNAVSAKLAFDETESHGRASPLALACGYGTIDASFLACIRIQASAGKTRRIGWVSRMQIHDSAMQKETWPCFAYFQFVVFIMMNDTIIGEKIERIDDRDQIHGTKD